VYFFGPGYSEHPLSKPAKKTIGRRPVVRALFVLVTVIGIAAGGAWIARGAREANRLKATRISFDLTEASLDHYDESHGHLPFPVRRETIGGGGGVGTPNGTGRPLYSWRAEVATYRDNWFFLQELYLNRTSLGDAALSNLGGLRKLWRLGLSHTRVTDIGLARLKGHSQLTELYLEGTQVTDSGLEHLAELTRLRVLRLDATRVSDSGLKHLYDLTSVRRKMRFRLEFAGVCAKMLLEE